MSDNGKKVWVFPDLEMPPICGEGLAAHESVIILNMTDKEAHIRISLFFDDKDPIEDIEVTVMPKRVRCLRTNNPSDFGGLVIEREKQYAMRLVSDVDVVAQYGRLDTTQDNMAFYTVMGFSN